MAHQTERPWASLSRQEDHEHGHDHHHRRRGDLLQGLGDRPAIVFSHGWPLSADDWDTQMLFFLGHGYRVIAHDRRGHGRSTQTSDGHDMDHYADDLAALTDTSRSPRCHARRPLDRWGRGRPLHRPPRREPGRQGGPHQLGAAPHGADRRQSRRPAEERLRRPAGPAGRQPLRVLPGPALGTLLRLQPARRRALTKRSSRTGGARE